ncbi:MAG: hypothetical protein H7X80_07390 [bacterium]|nr:hypothetical protein [Candidatus Kapabacteria bacterium]
MEILIWVGIVGGVLFVIWYGYGLLVQRPDGAAQVGTSESARCHLCRRDLPLNQMVTREKAAGFENHFCGDCIEELYRDYTAHRAARRVSSSMPGRN